jgi:hypothetical protein
MADCDDMLERLLLGRTLDAGDEAHVRACPRCAAERPAVAAVRARLAADPAPAPPPGLSARALQAAAPLLARNARRALWWPLARAVAVALLPLPLILLVDAWALRGLYGLLSAVLPETLSLYLVLNYAGLLALLTALTYGSIPLLAARQVRGRVAVRHG